MTVCYSTSVKTKIYNGRYIDNYKITLFSPRCCPGSLINKFKWS